MTVLKVLEVVAWVIFGAWLVFLFARLAMRKTSTEDKLVNTRVMFWALLVCGPLFLLVYGLETLDVGDAAIDEGRRDSEPWAMAFFGLLMTVSSVWGMRRLARGERE